MNNSTKESIIRLLYHYFSIADFDNIKQLFHPQAVWEQMQGFPNGGTHKGAEAIIQNVFKGFKINWVEWKSINERFFETDDLVFAIGFYEGTYMPTGKRMRADYIHMYELQNGKIIHFKQYTDTNMIAAAML